MTHPPAVSPTVRRRSAGPLPRLPLWSRSIGRVVAIGLACGALSPAVRAAFDLDAVSARARALALQPYRAPAPTANDRLLALSYDDYRDIRFRPEASVWPSALRQTPRLFATWGSLGASVRARLRSLAASSTRPSP